MVETGKSVTDIEREYGISRKVIYNWVNKFGTVTTSTYETTTNDEILKLGKQLREKEQEVEILKKQLPYSQNNR